MLDHKETKDSRYVTIQGAIDDVVDAAQKVTFIHRLFVCDVRQQVKDLSQRFGPDQGHSQKQSSVDRMDLMVIKAKASVKIIGLAAGYLIGKDGQNIKRMKEESHVQFLDVDSTYRHLLLSINFACVDNEDEEGFKTVNISGYVSPVLDAIRLV